MQIPDDRKVNLDSLRIACAIGSRDTIMDYRRARAKKGDVEALKIIDDITRIRRITFNPEVDERLIRRMMRY